MIADWTVKLSIALRRLLPPTADSCIESSSIVILPSPPRWLSTRLPVSRCCMPAKHGPLINVTSRLLRISMFVVFRPSLVSAGCRKYHTVIFSKTEITPVEHLLAQRQLRWLGHLIRLPDNRPPRRLLYGELSQGQRSAGGPKKCFSDHISYLAEVQHPAFGVGSFCDRQ